MSIFDVNKPVAFRVWVPINKQFYYADIERTLVHLGTPKPLYDHPFSDAQAQIVKLKAEVEELKAQLRGASSQT
jgi:hypothetical protein